MRSETKKKKQYFLWETPVQFYHSVLALNASAYLCYTNASRSSILSWISMLLLILASDNKYH